MPAWVTVYCSEPVDSIDPDQLLAGLSQADYWTLAEVYEVNEELVDPALARLQIIPSGENLQLHYRPEGERQLEIHRWTNGARIAEEIREVLEWIGEDRSERASAIQAFLPKVQGIVAVEMGFGQLEDLGIALAYEIARWFAHNCRGLIMDHNDKWFRTTDEWAFVEL